MGIDDLKGKKHLRLEKVSVLSELSGKLLVVLWADGQHAVFGPQHILMEFRSGVDQTVKLCTIFGNVERRTIKT